MIGRYRKLAQTIGFIGGTHISQFTSNTVYSVQEHAAVFNHQAVVLCPSECSVCLCIGKEEGIAGYGRKPCFSPESHTSGSRRYENMITLSLLCGGSWGGGKGEGGIGIFMGYTKSYFGDCPVTYMIFARFLKPLVFPCRLFQYSSCASP